MTETTDPHIDETVERLAELHVRHRRRAGPIQSVANRLTSTLGRPGSVALMMTLVLGWVGGNLFARDLGLHPLEHFPFPDLDMVATIAAFLVTMLILTTQRHEQQVDERRAQLTLQIAVLSEQKIAKIIALLEEQRRDNPLLVARHDPEAEQMARPSDPEENLNRIEASRLTE